MISAWNLLWIVPLSMILGFMVAALVTASGGHDDGTE